MPTPTNTSRARDPLPSPLPRWEFPAVILAFLLIGWLVGWAPAFSLVLGGLIYLGRYVENERERWRVLVQIVANTNLGGLETEARLQQLEKR